MALPGRDGDEKWKTGAGIMLRLGGRAWGIRVPPGVSARFGGGLNARCMSAISSSSSGMPVRVRKREGVVGIWLCGVVARDVARPGLYEPTAYCDRLGGRLKVRLGARACEPGVVLVL